MAVIRTRVGVKISEMVAKYAVRIVSLTGSYEPGGHAYTAIVVFEEEPIR